MMDEGKTGRAIPLADAARDAIYAAMKASRWTPSDEDAFWVTTDVTLANIAACERLAKAADNVSAAGDSEGASLSVEYHRALAAYREAVTRG